MTTHPPYFLNLIPPLSMGNPFPLPPSHSSATIPQFPHLRATTSSAPQQAQSYYPAPVQIHNPPHVQPPVPTFRAPAHKHAHHLHSIPPREKSTRTLIIDHMLWVHARTRFAQARAELGMTDRTGGPSSRNYTHRRRPENYDEEDEVLSEGEDLLFLKTRTGWPGPTHDDDDADHLSKQDLALARSLRLRAEGLESVISSMLDQPPPHHPTDDEEGPSPSSPKGFRTGSHPHTLPNGVRLRLALGAVINDLFARQAPPQPYRHTHPPKLHEEAHPHHPHHSIADLPETISPLVPLSGAFNHHHEVPYASSSQPYTATAGYTTHPMHTTHSHTHLHTPIYNHRPTPSPRVAAFYNSGADPSTANSPPSLRCPRHLHTGCEICVEAKSTTRPGPNRSSTHAQNKSSSSGGSSSGQWKSVSSDDAGGGLSGWRDGSGIGSGLLRPGIRGNALRRRVYDDALEEGDKASGTGNTKLSKLIPRFLRLSALVAAELGQEAREAEWGSPGRSVHGPPSPVMSRAMPLNQSRGKEREDDSDEKSLFFNALRPTREWYLLLAGLLTRAVLEGYLTAGWRGIKPAECLLLVGIGINNHTAARTLGGRAGTENRVVDREDAGGTTSGDGSDVEDDDNESLGDEEEFEEFDPDGLPSLGQAMRVLFPSLKVGPDPHPNMIPPGGQPSKGQAELEYEVEMLERLRRFYDVPESTPDLSTHMEDLAWSYPAEPVERSAVRFCEAVAKWRGKPELETYKKKSPSSPGISIDSLVHSNPSSPSLSNVTTGTPYSLASLGSMLGQPPQPVRSTQTPPRPRRQLRRPSIGAYFSGMSPQSGSKRGRDERDVEGREEGVKRVHM
ncbi:hypothetical protein NP233_g8690 [Leucocoprinus birnbaumii]|uniref:Uncharacterized protein n=1 Tax=Leucocoprinus birnbaumii TaxID=56174 RepID=A0AAD5VLU4_9AGAR|nr:hypothetical protein NP233_g8690 [Leucocoprinus birnbaumii]